MAAAVLLLPLLLPGMVVAREVAAAASMVLLLLLLVVVEKVGVAAAPGHLLLILVQLPAVQRSQPGKQLGLPEGARTLGTVPGAGQPACGSHPPKPSPPSCTGPSAWRWWRR